MALSNLQLWNYLRKTNPNFASHTAEGTKELFSEKGFESLKRDDVDALNEFFRLSLRVSFQKMNISRAKNPLEDSGLVEVYDTPNGGYTQRMAVNSIKPVTPAFKSLKDGDSVDPFIVRKPTATERFFPQNFDFQSFISVQDFQIKQIFVSEYGMSDFVAGIIAGLKNGYTVQKYVNILECLNSAINSTEYPLQDSQVVALPDWTDGAPTDEELTNLILQLKDIATQFEVSAQSNAYNALKFDTTYNADDFVVLMRAGIKNRIQTALMVGAYNPENLTIPFKIQEVENFGGLVPYSDTTELQEVYDRFGAVVGYVDKAATVNGYATQRQDGKWVVNMTSSGTTGDVVALEPDDVTWDDTNADIVCIIGQKGMIFENIQNGVELRPIYNPRGLYENYWLSSPNNSIVYDPLYGFMVIKKPENP